MRQAVEAQVLNPHCELGEHGLRQILTDVIEEVRQSVSQDIDGAEILHSLLNASWLQSLLKVYECLQRFLRDSPAPALDYASGLSLQLLIDIRSLPGCSEEAKELYRLLRQPHLQALLSAHDTVAQRDYEPVLPPMPEDLPDDEEATRIVCLVKNKQPLPCNHQRVGLPLPCASLPSVKRGGVHSHWDTLKRLTRQRLHGGSGAPRAGKPAAESQSFAEDPPWHRVRSGSYPPADARYRPAGAQPRCKPTGGPRMCGGKPMSQCRVCYTDLLWEQSVNRSEPSVYSSLLFDNVIEELDSGNEEETAESADTPSPLPTSRRWTMTPPCLSVPYYPNLDDYLQPGMPPRLRGHSPRIRTAPPSPMHPRRVVDMPPVELAKQESLDELRTTVQLAASSMETSTRDIKLLGEKMAAATERMTETVQDNSHALVLLTQVVDRLQVLLAATRTEVDPPKPAASDQDSTAKGSPALRTRGQRPSLTHQSRCSFPSLPSSGSSSSSLSSLQDAPSTSQGTSCLSVSCRGSPRTSLKNKHAPSPKKKRTHRSDLPPSKQPLTNGQSEDPNEAKATMGGRSNQRKKKRKKAA